MNNKTGIRIYTYSATCSQLSLADSSGLGWDAQGHTATATQLQSCHQLSIHP